MELLVATNLTRVAGVTLVADSTADAVIEALAERPGAGRRHVWQHAERELDPFAASQAGVRLARAHVDLLVTSGSAGREIALAARDAGLELSRAIVCGDAGIARSMLVSEVRRGDVIGLIGIGSRDQAALVAGLSAAARRGRVAA